MCLLDGTIGGTLPAVVTFHERLIELDNGDQEKQFPTIFQIIFEAVHHWGEEPAENVIITDVPETARMLVKNSGYKAIHFSQDYASISFEAFESDERVI